jgi:hypothetical protein
VTALCIGLFAFAFVAAPRSCEWGLGAYLWSGVAIVVILLATPFVLWRAQSLARRVLLSSGFAGLVFAIWVVGLFAADIRIICRLI